MANVTCFWLLLFLLLVREGYSTDYSKLYFEDFCHNSETKTFVIGSLSANSSAVVQASRSAPFLPNRHCTLRISSPLSYGVVLSIRHLEMRPFKPKNCTNYIMIIGERDNSQSILCVYSDDSLEYESYYTTEDMDILLHTEPQVDGARSDFTFTVTSFLRSENQCPGNMFHCQNKRCIWRGLTCNGHNNCGDRSDEDRFPCATDKIIALSVMGVIIACLTAGILAYGLYRWRRREDDGNETGAEYQQLPPDHPDSRNIRGSGSVQNWGERRTRSYDEIRQEVLPGGATRESPPPDYGTLSI